MRRPLFSIRPTKPDVRVLFLLLFTLITSCQHPQADAPSAQNERFSEVNLNLVDSLRIPLPFYYNTYASLKLQAYSHKSTNYILLANIDDRSIFEVDLDNGRVSQVIDISTLEKDVYPVFLFHRVASNQIVILRDVTNDRRTGHGSALFSVDTTGEIREYSNIRNSPFRAADDPKDSSDAAWYHHFDPMEGLGNRIFVKPSPLYQHVTDWNDFRTKEYDIPELGYMDIDEEVSFEKIDFANPDPKSGKYAPEQFSMALLPISKNVLILGYHKDSKLYKVEVENSDYVMNDECCKLIGESKPLPQTDEKASFNFGSTVFGNLVQANDQKDFLRFATVPAPEGVPRGDLKEFRQTTQWVGLYDTNLRLIGEGVMPAWFTSSSPQPVYHNGKIISVKKTASATDQLTLYFSEVKVEKNISSDRMTELKKQLEYSPKRKFGDISDFYSNVQIPPNSYVLLVPQQGCPFCINGSIDYYLRNLEEMKKRKIYLVVSGSRIADKVSGMNSEFIFVDESSEVENYLNTNVGNPSLMKWTGDKVSKQLIFNPDQVKIMDSIVRRFTEESSDQN